MEASLVYKLVLKKGQDTWNIEFIYQTRTVITKGNILNDDSHETEIKVEVLNLAHLIL